MAYQCAEGLELELLKPLEGKSRVDQCLLVLVDKRRARLAARRLDRRKKSGGGLDLLDHQQQLLAAHLLAVLRPVEHL